MKSFYLFLKRVLLVFLFLVIGFVIVILLKTPSLYREWSDDQKVLADIDFRYETVFIKNIRDFTYKTADEYIANYIDEEYKIADLETVDYIIEPFSEYDGPAHVMLSFGFSTGKYIVISIEIRKEKHEAFSAFYGITNRYELVYMIGTEQDLIKVRANHRKDDVYMYPIKANKYEKQALFISMLKRAKKLSQEPEFYNTITSNCTTNVLDHVNVLRAKKIPWSIEALLPAHSDKVIYDLGLIDTSLPFTEAREYYKINELSEKYADSEDYSQKIRKIKK